MDLAEGLIRAMADHREDQAMTLINEASRADLGWAAGALVSALWESTVLWCDGDEARAGSALHSGADTISEAVLMTKVKQALEGVR